MIKKKNEIGKIDIECLFVFRPDRGFLCMCICVFLDLMEYFCALLQKVVATLIICFCNGCMFSMLAVACRLIELVCVLMKCFCCPIYNLFLFVYFLNM